MNTSLQYLIENLNNLESDRSKEFYNTIFKSLLKINNINHYSRYTDKGPSIAERFNRTIRDMFKKSIILNGYANWINILPTIINEYNNRIHSSIKLTPIQASLKENEVFRLSKFIRQKKKD